MASLNHKTRPNSDRRPFPGSPFSQNRRSRSTSQMCLHRILTVISTVPPPPAAAHPPPDSGEDRTTGFDLNVESSPEHKESPASAPSSSTAEFFKVSVRDGVEVSDEDSQQHIGIGGERRSLAMLIEAAELIFGEFKDGGGGSELMREEPLPPSAVEKSGRRVTRRGGRYETAEEIDETTSSGVVRSKRGRARVLPFKYRDSVVEPLTQLAKRNRRSR